MHYVYNFSLSEQRFSRLPWELTSLLALVLPALRAGQLGKICHGNFAALKILDLVQNQKTFFSHMELLRFRIYS